MTVALRLARLALDNGADTRVRANAANRLTDPVAMRRVVLETDSDWVRQAAPKRITAPRELATIARDGEPPWEGLVATARARDPVLLGELARGTGRRLEEPGPPR